MSGFEMMLGFGRCEECILVEYGECFAGTTRLYIPTYKGFLAPTCSFDRYLVLDCVNMRDQSWVPEMEA